MPPRRHIPYSCGEGPPKKMGEKTMMAVKCIGAFFTAFFIGFITFEIYLRYRYQRILKFIHSDPDIELTHTCVYEAQKRFWIWPIRRAFK